MPSLFRTARTVVALDRLANPGAQQNPPAGPQSTGSIRPGLGSPWAHVPPALQPIVIADVFGLDVFPVSRAEAMSVPAMARARNLLCTLIARQPMRAYRVADDAIADPQPTWIGRTDTAQSAFQRMVWTVDDLLFYGESLWLTERGADGFPLIAERIPYEDWEIDADNRILIDAAPVSAERVIYFPSFSEGVLTYGARSIRMASGLDRAALDTARAPFKLELHQTTEDVLTEDEIDALIDRARTAIADNRGILYTNAHIQAIVHAYTADNLLTEGRNASAIDMARIANVPAASVDAVLSGSGITYQTGPSLNRALTDYGAGGFMSAVSARLSLNDAVANGQRVAFDLEQFLDPTPDASAAASPAPTSTPPPAPPGPGPSPESR